MLRKNFYLEDQKKYTAVKNNSIIYLGVNSMNKITIYAKIFMIFAGNVSFRLSNLAES